jgi:hypothetical protein
VYGTATFASNQQSLKIVPRNAFVGSVSNNKFLIENGTIKLKQ